MNKNLTLMFLASTLGSLIPNQSLAREGWVVTLQGEAIEGDIFYKGSVKYIRECPGDQEFKIEDLELERTEINCEIKIDVFSSGALENVKSRGHLNCGVSSPQEGFATVDQSGNWKGFDVAFCQAVASAVFGDPSKVEFSTLNPKTRFVALQSGETDIITGQKIDEIQANSNLGYQSVGPNYIDGQGFLVNEELGYTSATELTGSKICVRTGTTDELNLANYFRGKGIEFQTVPIISLEEGAKLYSSGLCDVYTADTNDLRLLQSKLTIPDKQEILPELISKEPIGPIILDDDQQWGNITRWTLNAMILAEELGITSENIDEMLSSDDPNVRRLLGEEGDLGVKLGLSPQWAYNVIKNVGNYGEAFQNNLTSPFNIERGLNAQFKDGGLLYAPLMR